MITSTKNYICKNYKPIICSVMLVVFVLLLAEIYAAIVLSYRLVADSKKDFKLNSKEFLIVLRESIDYSYSQFTTFDERFREYEEDDSPLGDERKFRKPVGLEYKKRPIIFFGCSCTFGLWVEKDKTLPAQVSKYTHRPVYNFALPGWGNQQILWLLEHEKKLDEIKNPEYAVYVFVDDHFRREMSAFPWADVPMSFALYSEKRGHFYKENQRKIYYHSCLYRLLSEKFGYLKYQSPLFDNYKENKLISLLKEENKRLKQKYPDIKFVVLLLDTYRGKDSLVRKIQAADLPVFDGSALFGGRTKGENHSEYYAFDGHPKGKMFSVFVPDFVEEFGM